VEGCIKGLPEPRGTLISFLAANPKVAGEFYAVNNRGIFCSADSGISWKMLEGIHGLKGTFHSTLGLQLDMNRFNLQSLNCNPKSPVYYTLYHDMTGF